LSCFLSSIGKLWADGGLRDILVDYQGRIQDFKLVGGALKKFASSGEWREHFWGICVKNHDFTPKYHIFSNCRGGGGGAPSAPPPWIRPDYGVYAGNTAELMLVGKKLTGMSGVSHLYLKPYKFCLSRHSYTGVGPLTTSIKYYQRSVMRCLNFIEVSVIKRLKHQYY
jgi:hypothetical protein